MFGGGVTTSMSSSGSAQRLLTRVTVASALLWGAAIVTLGLLARFNVDS